jgi:hypothetical protein
MLAIEGCMLHAGRRWAMAGVAVWEGAMDAAKRADGSPLVFLASPAGCYLTDSRQSFPFPISRFCPARTLHALRLFYFIVSMRSLPRAQEGWASCRGLGPCLGAAAGDPLRARELRPASDLATSVSRFTVSSVLFALGFRLWACCLYSFAHARLTSLLVLLPSLPSPACPACSTIHTIQTVSIAHASLPPTTQPLPQPLPPPPPTRHPRRWE